ncbi:MFS transporter [Lactobacillus xylocopicola]|uniref:Uncharacterized protein n=1 Tax=Lactobacillus xylocopicola TaxID=2976676 RepID=A0ABN6SP21_9LACO|nr:MFS transporter [Lactobacillus xylocopicola]BDR60987.1 hypothetical protein KIM322_12480 [Lactobacillus xylocopicola]
MVTQVALTFLLSAAMAFLTHNYALALVLAGALSICDEFFNPADRAILKGTISNDAEMTGVISQVNMIDQVVSIAGTALSGVLLTLITSGQIILLCSGLSLLGLLLLLVAFRRVPTQNLHQESNQDSLSNYWQRVTSGYYYIKQNQFLNRYFWSSLLFSFATPAMMLILPRIAQKAGKP